MKYLQTLHTRSHDHRNNFALLASGSVTLVIFAIWALVHFGPKPEVAEDRTGAVNLAAISGTLSPSENIIGGIKDAWYSLTHLNGR